MLDSVVPGQRPVKRLEQNVQETFIVSNQQLHVPESRVFSYPSRLNNPWVPSVGISISPAEVMEPLSFELTTVEGSTGEHGFTIERSLSKKDMGAKRSSLSRRIVRKLYGKGLTSVSAPIDIPTDQVVFDTRGDIFLHDGNIAHILCNTMPLLLQLRSQYPNLTVILRQRASRMARQIYELMGFSTLYTDRDVSGRILTGTVHNQTLQRWKVACFGQHFDFVRSQLPKSDLPDRIFLSRRGSRSITNEGEIESLLSQQGFQKVYAEDFSIPEQWAMTNQAKVVVAVHGAAMANLTFGTPQLKVIELMHPGFATRLYRIGLSALGAQWCGVTGQMPEDLISELDVKHRPRHFAEDNINIHPESLTAALDYLNTRP